MWLSSQVGLVGDELVDERAREVALEGFIYDRPLTPSDFQSLARPALMRAWQAKWDSAFLKQKHEKRTNSGPVP
jgi:hypothetical protein